MPEKEIMNQMNDNENIGLKNIIVGYLHHWKLFLLVFMLSLIPAILYLVLYPKTFEVYASIQIQDDEEMGGGNFGVGEAAGLMRSMGISSVSTGVNVEDEIVTLSSVTLMKEMVEALGLQVEYKRPFSFHRLYENIPFVLTADAQTKENLYEELTFRVSAKKDKIQVKVKSRRMKTKKFTFDSLPAEITLPHGVFVLNYTRGKENLPYKSLDIRCRPIIGVAEDYSEDIHVEDFSKTSNIVELTCQDHEVKRGVDVLSTLINRYNDNANAYKKEEEMKMIAFFDHRIESVTNDLQQTELEIAKYKYTNSMTMVEQDVMLYVEQMKELQIRMIDLEAQAYIIRMMDEFVKDPENRYNLVPSMITQEGESSPIITYNELLLERARVMQTSRIDNPLVGALTEQVDMLRPSVFLAISNAQDGVQMTINTLKKKESEILAKMKSFPNQEKDYRNLVRQQEIFQGIYLVLLQKREESALNAGIDKNRAKMIDTPFVRTAPVGPRKLYALIGIMVLTLLIPVGYLFCWQQYKSLKQLYKETKN